MWTSLGRFYASLSPFLWYGHVFVDDSIIIRDKIIPHAVSWFTGEAIEEDELDGIDYDGNGGDYDDEDEVEDKENDDGDEEDKESDKEVEQEEKRKQGVKKDIKKD